MATPELAGKLERRVQMNESEESERPAARKHFNINTEFKEFSLHEIREFQKIFTKYDNDRNGFLDLMELKLMMEKLEVPQTHISLKAMIKEVDEDNDGMISFREFMLIFRKARAGDIVSGGLVDLCKMTEIDVSEEGVLGAKKFFEAKIDVLSQDKKFEQEILHEKEAKKQEAEASKVRRQEFKEKAKIFE